MSVIEIKNLTKYYGKFKALDQINLTLNEGEVLGFIGPNGAGKTTTIRILLGLLRKSDGDVHLFGKDAWQDAVDIHRHIAYVPGDVHLWPNLTGGEVIDLFGRLGGGVDPARREALIRMFDLDPSKKCRTYSKGNRQKVGLIAAFASNAELIILDEPTSGLDPLMASIFQSCVEEAKQAGRTVLMSSHILADVEKLCDRVAIIRRGQIIETGSLSAMRHMTRNTLEVETVKPVEALHTVEGVHGLKAQGNHYVFELDHDKMDAVMQILVSHGLRHLNSSPPTLEALFMRHYGDDLSGKTKSRRSS
ncbi:MAG: ABC transporter ATP-binding protein [Acholeplasmatales bacterium]|nr:MAG: ABC transporter ATP-binding protein [Acholeplasmatales bacterium]